MAATAKQSSSDVRGSSSFSESDEDIASIAKQISDHAEAIYQTWKSRGLAPTEILNCRPETDNTFNKTLSPKSPTSLSPRNFDSTAELLAKAPDLSNNNLKQLVDSFVNEDKARIAAQQGHTSPVSSIKYKLKKFENLGGEPQASCSSSQEPISIPFINPHFVNHNNNSNKLINKDKPLEQQQNKHVPDVLKDTIDQKSARREKPETPHKPEHLLNHVPTWPLKNRVNRNEMKNPEKVQIDSIDSSGQQTSSGRNSTTVLKDPQKPGTATMSIDVMDEVTREEEKLINALKTGTVLNDISTTSSLPEVITSSLKDNQFIKADQQNGVDGNNVNDTNSNINNNNNTNNLASSTVTPPPQKPNHTPIFVHHKEENTKSFKNFTHVATTRIPTRAGSAGDINAIFPQKDKDFQFKTAPSPVRPFLSRGSVAERVLIFEKCPEKTPARPEVKAATKLQIKQVNKILPPLHSTLQRHLKKSNFANFTIPQFFFPNGKPPPTITTETTVQRLELIFDQFENAEVPRDKFHIIVTICQVPLYWRVPLFMCTPLTKNGCVNGHRFLDFWRQMTAHCHDAASRFIHIISRGNRSRQYILPEDMAPLIQDVVDTHPGLAFLKEAQEFHSRYVHTVIARIYYAVNRSWSGRITVNELRRSNLLEVIQFLEEEEDINQIMAYFSYEHFYVIYCKFWELDRDHDLYIDQQDLARHNDHALSSRIIERIFSGCVTRGRNRNQIMGPNGPRMSYTDFVWFLLAEEDKNHSTAIEYWFRCMDIDGDGLLSMYELEYFYEEQQHRMEQLGIESLPFEDCLCQMLDMIKPMKKDCVTLSDLKRCKMTPIFFDTFFNLEKYMEHEQRDPFATKENEELSDWDRYAAQEYELLVAEESGEPGFEDDEYENNIDLLESQIDDCVNEW